MFRSLILVFATLLSSVAVGAENPWLHSPLRARSKGFIKSETGEIVPVHFNSYSIVLPTFNSAGEEVYEIHSCLSVYSTANLNKVSFNWESIGPFTDLSVLEGEGHVRKIVNRIVVPKSLVDSGDLIVKDRRGGVNYVDSFGTKSQMPAPVINVTPAGDE